MTQTDFNFSFPVNPFTEGTHNHILFEHLRVHRAITTRELHHDLKMDTARLRDLRKHLSIECRTIPGVKNDRLYRVRI